MSYNFEDESPLYSPPSLVMEDETAYPSPEDFSEEEFEAVDKGVASDAESDATRGFHRNLALDMEDNELVSLAAKLLEDVDNQLSSREEWESGIETAMKYLGRKIEEPNDNGGDSSIQRAVAFDMTMSTALYRTSSVYTRELFPPDGPCRSQIIGVPTKEIEEMAERREMFSNYALTVEDKGYYPDSYAMVLNLIFEGSAFRKVFQDPITLKPKARFIKAQDFIADLNCTTLLSSNSLGFRYKLTKREIQQRMKMGHFVKFNLSTPSDSDTKRSQIDETALQDEGISIDAMENKDLYEIHERHVYLLKDEVKDVDDLVKNDDDLTPYLVTIVDKRVVEIKRNWEEDDEARHREEEFVSYKFLEGFGLYGVGMAHLVGSNAITATTLLRQMIQKASLNIFPGGLKTTTLRSEDNIKNPDTGSWVDVETGGLPIRDCFEQMPYPPVEPTFFQLLKDIQEGMLSQLGVTETTIPENSAQTPVGTTLSALEVANRLQSASLSFSHMSLRFEFELLFKLWKKTLPDAPYPFKVPGYEGAIMRSDFSDNISIVPVSDPNILTRTHRLMNVEGLIRLSESAPEIYNVKNIHRRMLDAMGVENPEEIIEPDPEPQALDAISENMLVLQGLPIKVDPEQNHLAHNVVHDLMIQRLQANPDLSAANPMAIPILISHKQMHAANQLVFEARQTIDPQAFSNVEPEEYLNDMMIQNRLTEINAEEAQAQMQAEQEQQAAQAEQATLPQQVMMEDIKARKEIEELKAQVAMMKIESDQALQTEKVKTEALLQGQKIESEKELATQKTEADAFKEQLHFEGNSAKIEADLKMAEEQNETDLIIEEMKHAHNPSKEHKND